MIISSKLWKTPWSSKIKGRRMGQMIEQRFGFVSKGFFEVDKYEVW